MTTDDRTLGFVSLDPGDVAVGITILEAIVRLVQLVSDWLSDDSKDAPMSACLVALATMIDTDDGSRAKLVHAAKGNPVLRAQLEELCGRYGATWRGFRKLGADLAA